MPFSGENPFEEFEDLLDRMGREFESNVWDTGRSVAVDVAEQEDAFVVTADLPGFEKDAIDVTLDETTLRIEAERESSSEEREGEYLRQERHSDSARRSVRLPEPVEEDGVEATYAAGVLTVRLPKRTAEDAGKRIEVE